MMEFDGNTLFNNEIKPVVTQLLDLCRQHRLPLVLAIGISREANADNMIVGDVFQTCRIITGEASRMSSPMLAAGMVLNDDLANTVRKAVLSHLVSIAAATITGEGDDDTLEAARIVAAYSVLWRIINRAGIAGRTGNAGGRGSSFERFSPSEMAGMPGAGPFSAEAMDRVLRLMGKRDENQKSDSAQDKKEDGSGIPPELYDQLKAMFDETEDDKDK
jgi:hypothetical protein